MKPGDVTAVTDPLSHATSFGYDSYGNRTTVTNALSKTWTYAFDTKGRVTSVTDPLSHATSYTYSAANLVLILSFKSLRNICVDTHVHRISNRLGWVRTRTPDETEQALYKSTRERWWPYINLYLVTWGQNVCRPIYPRCGACVIREHCPQIGVTRVAKR